jgi:hypothetical protein
MPTAALTRQCGQIPWCDQEILKTTVELALEIARGRPEGRRIGTWFTLNKADGVLGASRPLIFDPLARHAPATLTILTAEARSRRSRNSIAPSSFRTQGESLRRPVISTAPVDGIDLPLGLGGSHLAAEIRGLEEQCRDVKLLAVDRLRHEG